MWMQNVWDNNWANSLHCRVAKALSSLSENIAYFWTYAYISGSTFKRLQSCNINKAKLWQFNLFWRQELITKKKSHFSFLQVHLKYHSGHT